MPSNESTVRKRTNRLPHLGRFLRGWDQPNALINFSPVELCKTSFGSINRGGETGKTGGDTLTRWHPEFFNSIEDGIRPLIELVIEHFDWITYSSCEGHLYEGFEVPPVPRHLGLVPRSERELETMRTSLEAGITEVHQTLPRNPVTLELMIHTLEGDEMVRTAVDLFFRRGFQATWPTYFERLDAYSRLLAKALSRKALHPPARIPRGGTRAESG